MSKLCGMRKETEKRGERSLCSLFFNTIRSSSYELPTVEQFDVRRRAGLGLRGETAVREFYPRRKERRAFILPSPFRRRR
ncbi:MAG: hypothetical protein D6679_13020 [Candidatus Hydrogenedentota bacterium]|nr:MAG: hypothetical protein D6679_13020 [Candidatus Hydrogenedentota bacterium]